MTTTLQGSTSSPSMASNPVPFDIVKHAEDNLLNSDGEINQPALDILNQAMKEARSTKIESITIHHEDDEAIDIKEPTSLMSKIFRSIICCN